MSVETITVGTFLNWTLEVLNNKPVYMAVKGEYNLYIIKEAYDERWRAVMTSRKNYIPQLVPLQSSSMLDFVVMDFEEYIQDLVNEVD